MSLRARLAALACTGGLVSCAIWAPGTSPLIGALQPAADPSATAAERVPSRESLRLEQGIEGRLLEHQTGLSPLERLGLAHTIALESQRQGVEVDMILAVIYSESGFNNFARSATGALGLMQILPSTGQSLSGRMGLAWTGPRSLLEPSVNVRLGTYYLRQLFKRYKRWDHALAAYNFGPAAVDQMLQDGQPIPADYAERVLSRFQSVQSAPKPSPRS